MDVLPDQEISLCTISQEGDPHPFFVVRKGQVDGVMTSRISEFAIHRHPQMVGVESIPSIRDVKYSQPLPLDEYLWARGRIWHVQPDAHANVREERLLFRHSDGSQVEVTKGNVQGQEELLARFLQKGGLFRISVNYGKLGSYTVTHEPGLTIRQASERIMQRKKHSNEAMDVETITPMEFSL